MGQEDGEGQPVVGWSRPLKSPQAFPIRKHILLVSGSVAGLLFVAVGYALLLTKNSLKNNHFLSAERQGNGSSHTYSHTHIHCTHGHTPHPFGCSFQTGSHKT